MTILALTLHPDAASFLERSRTVLMAAESANNLILGIACRLERFPGRVQVPPYLATVSSPEGSLQLAALMTPPHNLLVYSPPAAPVEACRLAARSLLDGCWQVPGVLGEAAVAARFAAAWGEVTGREVRQGMKERVYELREVNPPPAAPGSMRPAGPADIALVQDWFMEFQLEALGPTLSEAEVRQNARQKVEDGDIFLWEDALPVSLAGRNRPVVHSISVGPVYTPPVMRRRGYASSLVAGLSRLLLQQGWQYCNLYTNLANPTSNAIYQKIGYRPVCDFNEYLFD